MLYMNWLIAMLISGWKRISIPNPFHLDCAGGFTRTTYNDPVKAMVCIATALNRDERFIKVVNNLVGHDEQAVAYAVVRGDKMLVNIYVARRGIIEFATRNAYDPFWKDSGLFQLIQPKLADGVSEHFTALCPTNAEGLRIDFYSPVISFTHKLHFENQEQLDGSKACWSY